MSWLRKLRSWLGSAPSARRTRKRARRYPLGVEALERRELLSGTTFHLDLGTFTSPVAAGYTGVGPISYSTSTGYGWQSTVGISALDRLSGTSLTRDMHLGTDAAFLLDVPNGQYDVTVTLGDPTTKRDRVSIWAEGDQVVKHVNTAAGKITQPTFPANVVDGQLALGFVDGGGASNNWAV